MKKITGYILSAVLVMCIGGCGKPEEELPDARDTGGTADFSIDPESWGKDNSLDAYSRAVDMPLLLNKPENVLGGIRQFFLGAGRGYCYANYVLGTAKESWDELAFVTAEEETGSHRFDFEDRLFGIGPVAGTDRYIGFDYEAAKDNEEDNRYFLIERDENQNTVKEIPLDFLASPADTLITPSYLAADGSGIVHLVYHGDGGQKYLLVSPEGELLFSKNSDIGGLVPLYDGRIAFWESNWDSEERCTRIDLQCMDGETGEPVPLASLKNDFSCVTLFDKNTLLYADREGVYRCSLSGENPEPLYRWINHGIDIKSILALQVDGEGEIALLYEDSENYNYLRLKPTTEEVEICAITLAEVDAVYSSKYKPIVTAFNKRYPQWHIELKSDYDETALLTQLGAGDGPVLIDTSRTGFEELEKLWEPLDAVMEQLGITEELVPSVLQLGKIHGVQYGIVTEFWLHTLITGNQELKEWDYETFLQCIADSPDLEAFSNISDYYAGGKYGETAGAAFIGGYFCNGIDDAYFWDAEAGTTNFDSSEFRRALELANKYCTPQEEVPADRTLLEEGKVLVNSWSIFRPQEVAGLRIIYGEDANYIGFPTKNGSVHYIYGSAPLAVRRTATEEEKKVAVAFINFLLSYEGQQLAAKAYNFNMSVRRDMLEEQIAAMNKGTKVEMGEMHRFQFSLGDEVNVELDRNTLLHLIEIAEPAKWLPKELGNIIDEELQQYFLGVITEDVLIDRLESRVGLYLNERK